MEFLLDGGHIVVGVDNLSAAYDVRLKYWRLRQLEERPNFVFHKLDICHCDGLRPILLNGHSGFDAVINLAALAGVRRSVENPGAYFETNVVGTLNMLELCKKHSVKKFVLASSSSLYGANTPRPFREDAVTDHLLSPYAVSKKTAEILCYTYHYLYGLDVTVLRYFTVYGPAGRPDMSVFRFIRWIAEGEPLLLHGDGSQERDFTFIEDIARGTLLALKPLGYEIINLGSGRPVSVMHLIFLLERFLGRKAEVIQHPPHLADVPVTWAEISKARRLLDWAPETSLEEGLQQTVEWYLANRSWARDVRLS